MTGITEYASSARICSDTCCNGNKIEFDSVRLGENGLDMSSRKCTVSRKPIPIFFSYIHCFNTCAESFSLH